MNKRLKTLAARGKRGESFKAWLIMLPGLVLMTFFVWEPLLESVRMSLYKTENVELVKFIGLKNFVSVMYRNFHSRPILLLTVFSVFTN